MLKYKSKVILSIFLPLLHAGNCAGTNCDNLYYDGAGSYITRLADCTSTCDGVYVGTCPDWDNVLDAGCTGTNC